MTGRSLSAEAPAFTRGYEWVRRFGLGRKLAVALTVAALAAGLATYAALSGSLPSGRDVGSIKALLLLDAVLFLLLLGIVAVRLVGIWIERRRGAVGARLHTRLVGMFSLVALIPTLIVSVYAGVFFRVGLEDWFADRVRTAILESREVAQAYLEEHQQVIRGDVLAMAHDLSRTGNLMWSNPTQFGRIVTTQARIRNLTEATVFNDAGRVLARWSLGYVLHQEPLPLWAIDRARGGVVLLTNDTDDRLRAVVRLEESNDVFLYVGRYIEPRVLNHVERVNQAAAQYESIKGEQRSIEVRFYMMFVLVAFLLLLAAIWLGLHMATRLARPISALVSAAERVRAGDLSARVAEGASDDEIGSLSRAFNRMTDQIAAQRGELVEANRQLETRRQFMESVLSGVSAGVIGLDAEGRVNLPNRSASALLSVNLEEQIGQPLAAVLPEMADLLTAARAAGGEGTVEAQLNLQRGGRSRTLLARIACDRVADAIVGFVVTFDDVTELISAQRKAAWSDIARRIAHEIKNPLTPIQLSAERLHRKYLKEIRSDPQSFAMCTDTIIRHVDDIGRMVNEFSAFARMPAPSMRDEDVGDICRRAVALQESAHAEIEYVVNLGLDRVVLLCDALQIGRALTNLLQNAADAIEARNGANGQSLARGRIGINVLRESGKLVIEVVDNGIGLPAVDRDRLTEPYVTTRTRGTGLGLAIVRKIMEDHGGGVSLDDGEGGGTRVRLTFGAARAEPADGTVARGGPAEMASVADGA